MAQSKPKTDRELENERNFRSYKRLQHRRRIAAFIGFMLVGMCLGVFVVAILIMLDIL